MSQLRLSLALGKKSLFHYLIPLDTSVKLSHDNN